MAHPATRNAARRTTAPLPSQTTMVRRILRQYRAASAEHRAMGLAWYPTCYAVLSLLGPNLDRTVGVFAALSPRCQLVTNFKWCRAMLACADAGLTTPPVVQMEYNRATGWAIATGTEPLAALGTMTRRGTVTSGHKVRNFYRNIMGDTSSVTVDVWAARGALGDRDDLDAVVGTSGGYRAIEQAFQRAAAVAGIAPRDMQAVVWMHVRGVKPADVDFHAAALAAGIAA